MSVCAGAPATRSVSMSSPGATSRARVSAAARFRAEILCRMSATVAGFALRGRIRDGITDTDTMRSGALRRTASRAAHSTARDDCSEPSAPTTIGMLAMTVLLDWVALTGSELATDEGGQVSQAARVTPFVVVV